MFRFRYQGRDWFQEKSDTSEQKAFKYLVIPTFVEENSPTRFFSFRRTNGSNFLPDMRSSTKMTLEDLPLFKSNNIFPIEIAVCAYQPINLKFSPSLDWMDNNFGITNRILKV